MLNAWVKLVAIANHILHLHMVTVFVEFLALHSDFTTMFELHTCCLATFVGLHC